jgi:hypothetical protein
MNWKALCVVAGLALVTSLSACSQPENNETPVDSATPAVEENATPGAATKEDGTKTDGAVKEDATKEDAAKSGDATKKDATKEEGEKTKP